MNEEILYEWWERLRASYRDHQARWLIGGGVAAFLVLLAVIYMPQSRRQEKVVSELFTKGFQAMAIGNYASAAQAFERAEGRGFPRAALSDDARLYEAAALFGLERWERSEEAYTEFFEKNSGHELAPAAMMGIASTYEARNQNDQALAKYQAILASHPETYLADAINFRIARLLTVAGRYEEALAIYEALQKDEEDLWFELARGRGRLVEDAARAAQG